MMMKFKIFLALCIAMTSTHLTFAQLLPVKAITIFKNGRSMIERSGKVKTNNGVYSTNDLPDALFGTFWVAASGDALKHVFSKRDSILVPNKFLNRSDHYQSLSGKAAKIYLINGEHAPYLEVEGRFGTLLHSSDWFVINFQTKQGAWISFMESELKRIELLDSTPSVVDTHVELRPCLDVTFKNNAAEQDLSLSYLLNNLGWAPVYRLELTSKNKGRLSLRAEVVNDAEDFGNNQELRLAVGVPNFAFAKRSSYLTNFSNSALADGVNDQSNMYMNNNVNYQVAFDAETYEERVIAVESPQNPEGNQVEDYYFYKVRSGNLSKGSRYQFPVFETDIEPTHYYECLLAEGGPNRLQSYRNNNGNTTEKRNQVNHFIAFKNTTTYPWTTGPVNLFSGTDLQPISQDRLPYTASGATGKIRISETPEIKVTETEGDIKREENVFKFFNNHYDKVTIEGQVCVVNYKNEPVLLKIKRKIEGKPLSSDEQKWTLKQEAATLRVNSEYELEWEITLKPGEERKWKYQYEVLVNF